VDRYLREYSGTEPTQPEPTPPQPPETDIHKRTDPIPNSLPVTRSQPPIGKVEPLPKPPQTGEEIRPEPTETQKRILLKDPDSADYVIGEPAQPRIYGEERDERERDSSERRVLTDEEKSELEKAGRCIATRALRKLGYEVHDDKPPSNPGFDLEAKKDREVLRVEVKAHSGRATIVDLTVREYMEYVGQNGYRWELWNVEHLAKDDSRSVTLTPYKTIPEEALQTRIFRVDLSKCQ